MDDPAPTPQPTAPPTPAQQPAKKFWTGPKIAAAVVAAWLFLMVFANGSNSGDTADSFAAEETYRDTDPAGTILDPGYAAADAEVARQVAPEPEPSPEETGISAEEMIETELSNSVVY